LRSRNAAGPIPYTFTNHRCIADRVPNPLRAAISSTDSGVLRSNRAAYSTWVFRKKLMQRFAEDLRRHPTDVLRRQVERLRQVLPTRRLLLPIAILQEVLCGTNKALPMPGRERSLFLLSARSHRCARDRSDEVRNIGWKG
jgi:hypothetical protein